MGRFTRKTMPSTRLDAILYVDFPELAPDIITVMGINKSRTYAPEARNPVSLRKS
jgi:hypothetical protein